MGAEREGFRIKAVRAAEWINHTVIPISITFGGGMVVALAAREGRFSVAGAIVAIPPFMFSLIDWGKIRHKLEAKNLKAIEGPTENLRQEIAEIIEKIYNANPKWHDQKRYRIELPVDVDQNWRKDLPELRGFFDEIDNVDDPDLGLSTLYIERDSTPVDSWTPVIQCSFLFSDVYERLGLFGPPLSFIDFKLYKNKSEIRASFHQQVNQGVTSTYNPVDNSDGLDDEARRLVVIKEALGLVLAIRQNPAEGVDLT